MITALKLIFARVRALFMTRELDRDFEQELESHLAMLIEDNIHRGMPPEQARREALLRLGGGLSLKERHRQARGLPAVDAVLQDVRLAIRLIAKERWFSAAVIVVLALGIGVNAIGFTIVNAAFLRGLPFEDADRLYMLSWQTLSRPVSNFSVSEFQELRARTRTLAGVAAYTSSPMNISDDRAWPEEVRGAQLTAGAFGVLHQKLLLGRDFEPDEDRKGAERVVIIGYNLWKNRYGSDPDVAGKTLRVDGQPATIIGVMPDTMKFPDNNEIWQPFIPTSAQEQRNARPLRVFGRLKDDVDRRAAQAELTGIAQQLASAYSETNGEFIGGRVQTFTERFVGGPARNMFIATMAAVSLVLLIACANVANLLLSRSAHRAREIAMRMALGATRGRIVRQLLVESVVLGLIGGSIGLGLAVGGVSLLDSAIQDPGKPYWIVFAADRAVVMYVAAICVLTAIIFGLAPALHISKDNSEFLKEGGRSIAGGRRVRRLREGLVVAELALSLVLLAGGGLMFRSFMKLYTLDIGFRTGHLMTTRMQLPLSRYASAEARRTFFADLESRLRTVPGVESAALTTGVPPLDGGERPLEIDGPQQGTREPPQFVSIVTISPQFFDVIGVPLLHGRSFQDADGALGSETVMINERLASQFFRGEDPIGRRLRFAQQRREPGQPEAAWRTIIGITPSIRHGSPQDAYLNAVVYVPYRQEAPSAVSVMVRSGLAPAIAMDAIRRQVQAVDKDQPVPSIDTMGQTLAEIRWPYRVFGSLFAAFAVIALVLSSVGLYAVMAYAVAQQTQEIGVRMALGARRTQVSWLILKRGLVQLAIGLTVGLAGALALSRALADVLVDITPSDPLTFAAITMLLTIVSIAACLLPARRATRIDPLLALRTE